MFAMAEFVENALFSCNAGSLVDQVADSPKIKFAPMYILSETVLGKEHPSTLTSMNNLATVLW